MRWILSLALAALWIGAAEAGTPPIVLDRGDLSCEKWTADQKESGSDAKADDSWILGYFSGWNTWHRGGENHGLFLNYDSHNLIDWVKRYCAEHSKAIVAEAATNLIDGLELGLGDHNAEIKNRGSK